MVISAASKKITVQKNNEFNLTLERISEGSLKLFLTRVLRIKN